MRGTDGNMESDQKKNGEGGKWMGGMGERDGACVRVNPETEHFISIAHTHTDAHEPPAPPPSHTLRARVRCLVALSTTRAATGSPFRTRTASTAARAMLGAPAPWPSSPYSSRCSSVVGTK